MKTNRILQANAIESLSMARNYCIDIHSGKITLMYRKFFVSSLHNAVELFIKQIMLNNNDYRVINIKDITDTGEPFRSYLNATNLNDYFANLPKDDLKKFHSIEFNKITNENRKILDSYFNVNNTVSITEALRILNNLRNNETHFFIELESFLSESEFLILHNFMRTFYEILRHYSIAPDTWDIYFDVIEVFKYENTLKESSFVKELVKHFNGYEFHKPSASTYELTWFIYERADLMSEEHQPFPDEFYVLLSYVESLVEYNMLEIHTTPNSLYELKFNID